MKKSIILGACLLTGMLANAQMSVVKDVERKLKESKPNYAEALKAIQPALTNPETSNQYLPWYLAGKAAFGIYDEAYKKEMISGQLSNDEKKAAGHAAIDAHGYYEKAIALPDEKGKTPNKKAKEMIKSLAESYNDMYRAGFYMIQAGDNEGAYDAWEVYCNLPSSTVLGDKAPKSAPDSIIGQTKFYQSLAAFYAKQHDKSVKKANDAIALNYYDIDLFRVGLQASQELADTAAMIKFAEIGSEKFGNQEIAFIGTLININVARADYSACHTLIGNALAGVPADSVKFRSQLLNVEGIVYDQEGNDPKAIECFDQAIALDPNFARAYLMKGNTIYEAAVKADEASQDVTLSPVIKEEYLKATKLFEKAYELAPDEMTQLPRVLYTLYYRLGKGYEADAEKWQNM